ncbi:30S ribosome-binding factor RbfA [Sulfobacillus harzensis]|uniref:Ribosome-binding factor A n=1 Tax=Sulfobacillus harzensis TaxID=2729629 RepID=A0A7Y0L2J5_9FIRM|nr:30S ribosome-binding factor RbfA [Sulfobacillus harzensis]NMP21832.1 30S ribosome-binding factor RbfA [Sulfobacillus harzensis]
MNQSRAERIAQLMQRELGEMLFTEVKDPRIGFVSITRVDLTRDLSQARAYVSVMGDLQQKEASLTGLRSAAPFLRGEVARRLKLRQAPELVFREDTGIEDSMHIQDLIRSLPKDGEKNGDHHDERES